MNVFENLLQQLDHLGGISSTKDKKLMLAHKMENEHFKKLMNYLLNPFLRFGITRPLPCPEDAGCAITLDDFWRVLDSMASRQITGNAARQLAGSMIERGVPTDLMLRILEKDPKCGVGIDMVNAVCPGFIPEPPYMRCSLPKKVKLKDWPWEQGVYSQLKADGSFVNIDIDGDSVQFSTRQGQVYPNQAFLDLISEITTRNYAHHISGLQMHGELLVYRGEELLPRQEGNGILNSIRQGAPLPEGLRLCAEVWDVIPQASAVAKGQCLMPYIERFDQLVQLVGLRKDITVIENRVVYSYEEAKAHYLEILARGLEGTILKHPAAIWRDGTSAQQVKLKAEFVVDLRVKGFKPGNGKHAATFGSLLLATEDDELEVHISGFSDKLRKELWETWDRTNGSIMSVKANAIMSPSASNPKHSLFLPRFDMLRSDDKKTADTLQQVKDQYDAAISM